MNQLLYEPPRTAELKAPRRPAAPSPAALRPGAPRPGSGAAAGAMAARRSRTASPATSPTWAAAIPA